MRRPLIGVQPTSRKELSLQATSIVRPKIKLTGMALEKRLRVKRSESYTQALTKLDAEGAILSQTAIQDLIETIASEFPDLEPHQFPIGIIAKCNLGIPFEVHVLDTALEIVKHYKCGEALPEGMEKARSISLYPEYQYIEVFSSSLCAVTANGNVSIIKR